MRAATLVRLHTIFAGAAFLSALAIGSSLHFYKIVKNDVAQFPDEFFPSVSATIGDWYPERNIFQILIALTAGLRFALVFLQYFLHYPSRPILSTFVFFSGLIRTISCGGWVYVTSSDDHDVHDFMMILYMVCNLPWMLGGIVSTPSLRASVLRKRKIIAAGFFVSLGPLIYFFIQHKIHRIPGAYTRYAFFEWALIFFDVLYDSVAEQEFDEADLQIYLTTNLSAPKTIPDARPLASTDTSAPVNQSVAASVRNLSSSAKTVRHASFLRNILSFISDVYLAYIFWTLFTALIPTLFYFSVWKLGLAGHESALLAVLSPALLNLTTPYRYLFGNAAPPSAPKALVKSTTTMFQFARTRYGQSVLHVISLIGLAAYPVPSPGGRLAFVTVANALSMMRQATVWAGIVEGERDTGYQGLVLGLGILLTNVLKLANRGNNPVWPFINHKADGWNNTGIFLALLAIYEYHTRPISAESTPVSTEVKPAKDSPEANKSATSPAVIVPAVSLSPAFAALPLGTLLFSIHNLLGDSTTLIAWSWTGYENRAPRGPLPHVFGALTVLAMSLGLLFGLQAELNKGSSSLKSAVCHPVWFAFGAGSGWVMYAKSDWLGYIGGLGEAAFLMSLLPATVARAARGVGNGDNIQGDVKPQTLDNREVGPRVASVYTAAMGAYCVLNLASIFTVAYAFVPGGQYFRERTDLVVIAQIALLAPLFFSSSPAAGASVKPISRNRTAVHRGAGRLLLVLFPLLALGASYHRRLREPPRPFRPEARIIRTGIWAVHFGIDNEGHDSQRGMLRVIQDMELDVVGLLETDLHRTPFGHRDLSRRLVEQGNYYVDIGPGPNKHTWGCVLLSKFPIISTKHHLLPSPHGELAPAIEAILDVHGTEVLVLVSHNGQEEDPLDRELQATALAEIMAASTRPVIFLGYVVSKPHEPRPSPYGIMVDEGRVHDVDKDDLDRWCEYIFYRGVHRTSYARLSRGIITDTETQIAQFVVLPPGENKINDSQEARYLRSQKELLPEVHWFPMEYYGDAKKGGVNGHYYHVFGTPLYYRIPEQVDAAAEGSA